MQIDALDILLPYFVSGRSQEKRRMMPLNRDSDALVDFIYVVRSSVVIFSNHIRMLYYFSPEEKKTYSAQSNWITIFSIIRFLYYLYIYTPYLSIVYFLLYPRDSLDSRIFKNPFHKASIGLQPSSNMQCDIVCN